MKSTRSPVTSKLPRLRVGLKDVAREEFAAAVQEKLGKQRVSIMLDVSIIAFFKARAGERGYQTLINQALHQAMTGEQIAATLRQVIREELGGGDKSTQSVDIAKAIKPAATMEG